MKLSMFGFELKAYFGPTPETQIRYCEWLRKVKIVRCRLLHDSTWVYKKFGKGDDGPEGEFRWYCCRDCMTTWLVPITGAPK